MSQNVELTCCEEATGGFDVLLDVKRMFLVLAIKSLLKVTLTSGGDS